MGPLANRSLDKTHAYTEDSGPVRKKPERREPILAGSHRSLEEEVRRRKF